MAFLFDCNCALPLLTTSRLDMKKVIAFIISMVIAYTPALVFASAAEKWDLSYQVDRNNKVLKVTGHQVDKYGDAANDRFYNKDYKLSSSKIQALTKNSLKGRILRNPQLAVGSAALTAFLAYLGYEFLMEVGISLLMLTLHLMIMIFGLVLLVIENVPLLHLVKLLYVL